MTTKQKNKNKNKNKNKTKKTKKKKKKKKKKLRHILLKFSNNHCTGTWRMTETTMVVEGAPMLLLDLLLLQFQDAHQKKTIN